MDAEKVLHETKAWIMLYVQY